MRKLLPKRSESAPVNYGELLGEATHFGLQTQGQFRRLIIQQRRVIRQADRGAALDLVYVSVTRRDLGEEFVADRLRRQYWFGWEAMVRTAFAAEFGARYDEFASRRDAV